MDIKSLTYSIYYTEINKNWDKQTNFSKKFPWSYIYIYIWVLLEDTFYEGVF